MKDLRKCVEGLQAQIERHHRVGLKEYPTRTIFSDPLVGALGWDVRDPDEVELEFPTIDGKSVDYALKINRKPVALIEAKPLNDSLDDVKAITQVVGYAANGGIEWCVLTNGIKYKVYRSSERAAAPDKLLFEVSIDPRHEGALSIEQVTAQLMRLSKGSLAHGALDALGEEIFTAAKVRKALDRLFADPPGPLVRIIRKTIGNDSITTTQVRDALPRIWRGTPPDAMAATQPRGAAARGPEMRIKRGSLDYGEAHHTEGNPKEVIELYRALDRICQDLAPGQILRRHLAKYVAWSRGKHVFCSAHLQRSGLRVWLKLDPTEIPASSGHARDVSNIGHWGVGDVALAIDNTERLLDAEPFIRASFDKVSAG